MKKLGKFTLFSVCMLAFMCSLIFSQSQGTGAIRGTVATPDGEILPGVEITLSSPNLIGGNQSVVSNDGGRFRFVALLIGTYTVEARLMGFTPQRRDNIRLSVGETLTVDFALEIGGIEEEITVISKAPMIDIKDSQIATTEMDYEFLQKIPSGRSMRSQLKFAPGVYGASHASAFGSSESLSNNFMIDGVKVNSPEAGEAEVSIDFDSVEEMKVMGIGAPAEYGGYSGVVVNVVTKSGGNKLRGLFNFFLRRPGWHSENWGDYVDEEGEQYLLRDSWMEAYDFHANLGGPIMKDKLWFYVSGKYVWDKQHIIDYEGPTEDAWVYHVMGKLTWQADSKNRFGFILERNADQINNIEAGPWQAPEATPSEGAQQWFFNANYLHIFSDTTFLEAKFGGYDQKGGINLKSDDPAHFDFENEYLSGNFWEYWDFPRQRLQLNTSVSHHAEDFIGGSHDFKFGVEVERSTLTNARGYAGGVFYEDYGDEPYYMFAYDGYSAKPTTVRVSGFVQDSWTIGDRLTINPGLRINHVRGSLPSPVGTVFKPKLGIAPRLGITYDVFGDHSTALKIHYGKYYHGIMGMFYLHFQPQGDFSSSVWGPVMTMWDEEEFADTGEHLDGWPFPDDEYVLEFTDVWEDKYTMDPNLKMAYMNQFVVGIERELGKDIAVGASFIYRTNHDFMDRVNITGEWVPVQWTNPYETDGKTYTVYERINPGDNNFYVTNPKEGEDYGAAFPDIVGFTPTRKYRGLEFTFDKRYSNGWQLQASYVNGKSWGSDDNTWGEYADNRTSSLGASTKYGNPNFQINAEGRLGFDPTHMLKIMGSIDVPVVDVSLGFYYSFMSGITYNKNIMLPGDIDSDPVSWGNEVYIYADEKGSYRYPSQHNLDLRVEKFLKIGNYRLGILIDLFNVLNDSTEDDYETYMDPWSDYQFGHVWGLVSPRTFRAAIRFEF